MVESIHEIYADDEKDAEQKAKNRVSSTLRVDGMVNFQVSAEVIDDD
jgi:hypothetical protein